MATIAQEKRANNISLLFWNLCCIIELYKVLNEHYKLIYLKSNRLKISILVQKQAKTMHQNREKKVFCTVKKEYAESTIDKLKAFGLDKKEKDFGMQKFKNLLQQMAMVFAPLHEFKDCSVGTKEQRWAALEFNKRHVGRLVESMKNCALLALGSFIILWVLDLFSDVPLVAYVQMLLGITVALGLVGLLVQGIMYTYLKYVKISFN